MSKLAKLHQIYTKRLLLLFATLILLSSVAIYFWLKSISIQNAKKELLHDITIAELFLSKGFSLDETASLLHKSLGVRLTIIDAKGKVVAKSSNDKNSMDKLINRPEIIMANLKGIGTKIRHSKMLDMDFLYLAKKTKEGFIRASKPIEQINKSAITLFWQLIAAVIGFLAIAIFMLYKINLDLEKEIKKIVLFLKDLTKKRKEAYISSHFSKEFYQITKMLTKVAKILQKRDKQKAKYTKKLERSNAQKENIISAISHEFKNPIAVISGYAQALIEDKNISQDVQKRFLEKIYKNSNKLSSLIDRLRLLIRLESKNQQLIVKHCNIVKLLQKIVANLQESYPNRVIHIIKKADITIELDELLFEIVLENLIENALKYSDDEVTILIQEDAISIIDKGIGIEAKELEKIKTKYYQVAKNSWNNSLGIGLSIVDMILKIHGFSLELTSQPDKGSIFKIKFK